MATPTLRALPKSVESTLVPPLRLPGLLFGCTWCAFTCASVTVLLEHRRLEHERWALTPHAGGAA